jgi:hypothetical protein
MTDKPVLPGQLRSLWQSMPTDPVATTVYDMRMRAALFEGRIRRRNRIEFIACAIVAAVFTWYATFRSATVLWPIANILIALTAIYVAFNLHRRGKAGATPDSGTVPSLIDFHRQELIRQRDALRSIGSWYVLPFAPGLVLWFVAMWIGRVADGARPVQLAFSLGAVFLLVAAVFALIWLLNLLGAARLQRMIEDLSRYTDMDQFTDLGRLGDFGRKEKK